MGSGQRKRLSLIIFLLLFWADGKIGIVPVHAASNEYCLRIPDPAHPGKFETINPRTGRRITGEQPTFSDKAPVGIRQFETPSPDGRYTAYLTVIDDPTVPTTQRTDLVVESATPTPSDSKQIARVSIGSFGLGLEGMGGGIGYLWSPQSNRIAYTYSNADQHPRSIGILNIDTHEQKSYETPAPDITWYLNDWSPDGAYFAVTIMSPQGYRFGIISILDMKTAIFSPHPTINFLNWAPHQHRFVYLESENDGKSKIMLADVDRAKDYPFAPAWGYQDGLGEAINFPTWTSDGKAVVFFQKQNGLLNLVSIGVDNGSNDVLVAHAFVGFYYANWQQSSRLAIPWRGSDGRIYVDLMDANGENRLPLLSAANNVRQLYTDTPIQWSPDHQRVAVAWLAGNETPRRIHLTWTTLEGTQKHDLTTDFDAVLTLDWLTDNRTLIVTFRQHGRLNLAAFDTQTGAQRLLLHDDTYLNIFVDGINDQPTGPVRLYVEAQSPDGTSETDGYDAAGQLLYHYGLQGNSPDTNVPVPQMSPDNRFAVVITHALGYDSVQLASELSTIILTPVDAHYVDAQWSPDSTMVATAYQTDDGHYIYEIVNTMGQHLWRVTYPQFPTGFYDWLPCYI